MANDSGDYEEWWQMIMVAWAVVAMDSGDHGLWWQMIVVEVLLEFRSVQISITVLY